MEKNLNIAYLNGAEGLIRKGGASSGGSGSGGQDICTTALTITSSTWLDENTTQTIRAVISLDSLKVVYNNLTQTEAIIKKIDYTIDGVENVYALSIEGISLNEFETIEITSITIPNNNMIIGDSTLIKDNNRVVGTRVAGGVGGYTVIWEWPKFDYFEWYVYDISTDKEIKNVLFILKNPIDAVD